MKLHIKYITGLLVLLSSLSFGASSPTPPPPTPPPPPGLPIDNGLLVVFFIGIIYAFAYLYKINKKGAIQ